MNYRQREAEIDAIPREQVLVRGTTRHENRAGRRAYRHRTGDTTANRAPQRLVPTGGTILIESSKCIERHNRMLASLAAEQAAAQIAQ